MRNRYGAFLVFGAFGVLSSGCKSGTDGDSGPATLQVSPGSLNLTSIGESQKLNAAVVNQSGDTLPSAGLTWTSNNTAVVTVNAQGFVTAVGNGTTTVTAIVGSLSANVPVTVIQTASGVTRQNDNQSATVNTQLAQPIQVTVRDAALNPMAGIQVTFTPNAGSVGTPSTVTNASGIASTTWTLGQTSGPQSVTVAVGSLPAQQFNANAVPGPPTTITIIQGNNQTWGASGAVPINPGVRVTDQFNNAKPGASVSLTVTAGGGTVAPTTNPVLKTDTNGLVTVPRWTLGASAGVNSLNVGIIGGSGASVDFNATAQAPGSPGTMVAIGATQTGKTGAATNVRPGVQITDNAGVPVAGVTVNFAVGSGGGSISGSSSVVTNANGVAQLAGWTLGLAAGTNTLTATAVPGGITGNPATFTANGIVPGFNITLRFLTTLTASQQAAFTNAAARWGEVIIGDLPDMNINRLASICAGSGVPAVNETVDDVLIFVTVQPIDGVGTILGQAGPCNPGFTPPLRFPVGAMRFDDADLQTLETNGRLNAVILHEMGHVLGIGTLWQPQLLNLVVPTSVNSDAHYKGAAGRAGFDSIGGTNYSLSLKTPVENSTGLQGTDNGHWRESVFDEELMTGFIEPPGLNFSAPMSLMTIQSLVDLGYVVSFAAADVYAQPFAVRPAFRPVIPQPTTPWEVVEIPEQWILLDTRTHRVVRVIENRR